MTRRPRRSTLFPYTTLFRSNEVMEQWTNGDSTAIPIARELAGIARRLDPTRPITSASNNGSPANPVFHAGRSEEHTSEIQAPSNPVSRLLLDKKTSR